MTAFILAHPYLSAGAAIYLIVAVIAWLFIAGAAIANGKD